MTVALVDANNFFVSCERVFDPRLAARPVVVLSNNDGCAIARSEEAKTLGVKMGAPWFQLREFARRHGIVALSSNYALYADMSDRLMGVLGQFSPDQAVYSIDECFLGMAGLGHLDLADYGRSIRHRVAQWLGLPVCVGIAATKTLAKLANHCAKKRLAGSDGVCDFGRLTPAGLSRLLATIPVGETWGVGRQLAPRLAALGIASVEDLRRTDAAMLREKFSVALARTVAELNGQACIDIADEATPNRQQIISSRSFGRYVFALDDLAEAVASHIAIATEKLRAQGSIAALVQVYIRTNPHRADAPLYQGNLTVPLPEATGDTLRLTRAALWGLRRIYRPGLAYQKAGVALLQLRAAATAQPDLFASARDNTRLMETMDRINALWGRGTLRSAATGAKGVDKRWHMKRDRVSPGYTTAWTQLAAAAA